MREILFRGKRESDGKWVYGFPKSKCDSWDDGWYSEKHWYILLPTDGCYEVDPATIGQYTGLNDVNEEKIFDGDILNERKNDTTEYIEYIVVWQKEYGRFALSYDNGNYCTPIISTNLYEIVGNIYDNPPKPTTEEIDEAIDYYNRLLKCRNSEVIDDSARTALWALEQEKERREKEERK